MTTRILSVTFEIDAMNHSDGHFSIPTKVCNLLDLEHGDKVHLIVSTPNGGHLFAGPWEMKSGFEIYGPEMKERIKAGDRIRVEVSKP